MWAFSRVAFHKDFDRFNSLLNRLSQVILAGLIAAVVYHDYAIIHLTSGGNDLVSADIPKSLMVLHGQDPYSTQPWAAPYPPLLLLTVAGIIRVTSYNLLSSPVDVDLISQNLRLVGLGAYSLVAVFIYLSLRCRGRIGLYSLVPASIFMALPAITVSPLYWFNSDTFGYPIFALSILFMARNKYFTGTILLATSAAFKIHPILAVPLIFVWLAKRQGIRKTLPGLVTAITIISAGLAFPLYVPGYSQAILGFNLSNTGNRTTSFTLLNLTNSLVAAIGFDPTQLLTNEIWIATTALLFTIVLGVVWTRSRNLDPTSVILLGLLAWLIPLKQLYTHYLVWAMIPILMRGKLGQTILAAGLLQTADTMATWSFIPSASPVAMMGTMDGFVATSTVYLALGLIALATTLRGATGRTISVRLDRSGLSSSPA